MTPVAIVSYQSDQVVAEWRRSEQVQCMCARFKARWGTGDSTCRSSSARRPRCCRTDGARAAGTTAAGCSSGRRPPNSVCPAMDLALEQRMLDVMPELGSRAAASPPGPARAADKARQKCPGMPASMITA